VEGYTLISMLVFLLVFLAVCAVSFFCYLRLARDQRQAVSRLRQLAAKEKPLDLERPRQVFLIAALTGISKLLSPGKQSGTDPLGKKLIQAGFFSPFAPRVFLGSKLLLMVLLPALLALLPFWLGLIGRSNILLAALAASCLGMALPSIWLGQKVHKRQRLLRQALPDAMDMLVLCMEGGISLVGACQRMTEELQAAHPILGAEMNIVQREIQLGLSVGASLKKLGGRCGLEEVRELANVLLQSERFGASVVKSLRTHAEGWRIERQQRAEEMAQKAAVKILFPTLLCIFPAIFIVLLGPAAFQMAKLFSK
jgi:tight adherence protein C